MRSVEHLLNFHATWSSKVQDFTVPDRFTEEQSVNFDVASQQNRERTAREAQMAAHAATLILCPDCEMLNQRANGSEHVTCGNPNDPYGGQPIATARTLGALGCGARLNALANKIPAHQPNGSIMPHFRPQITHLPVSLVNAALPSLPHIVVPVGKLRLNYVAIVKFLLAHLVHKRIRFVIDRDDLFPCLLWSFMIKE